MFFFLSLSLTLPLRRPFRLLTQIDILLTSYSFNSIRFHSNQVDQVVGSRMHILIIGLVFIMIIGVNVLVHKSMRLDII
jgi:polysaccharide pyruvyl transferase WcaK-like protein